MFQSREAVSCCLQHGTATIVSQARDKEAVVLKLFQMEQEINGTGDGSVVGASVNVV